VLLVKLIEPPYTERYVRWCERSEFLIYEKFLLLDHITGIFRITGDMKKSVKSELLWLYIRLL